MSPTNIADTVKKIIEAVERRIPSYLANPEDEKISGGGHVAVCVIDPSGNIYGKIFGPDKNKARSTFSIAWRKVSQVWITGIRTSKFEELAYAGKIDENKFGIMRPDYIGWEGGIPIPLDAENTLAAAFSGFRGVNDVDILRQSAAEVLGHPIPLD
jgi:hypothetical protein